MSVLRKRSPWFIPAASLLLGALTLGLAGCGGGDDDPFAPGPNNPGGGAQTFNVPAFAPVQAQSTLFIGAGGGGTLTINNLNPNQNGGATSVTVTVAPGTNLPAGTYGIAVIPNAQGSIQGVRNAGGSSIVQGIESIAEIVFGRVNPDGTINEVAGEEAIIDTIIELAEANANALDAALAGNNRALQTIRVRGNVASSDPECVPQFTRVNRNVTITKCRGGRAIVVHRPRAHTQGGGSS